MLTHEQIAGRDSSLDLRIATSASRPVANHVLLLAHGLPRAPGMGRQAASLLPELAEHLANESGWTVATGTLSGVGASTGNFSPRQWREDLNLLVDRLATGDARLSIAAFGFGGALALRVASENDRVHGVACFATPAHLAQWSGDVEGFHQMVRSAGVVHDEAAFLSPGALHAEVLAVDPLQAISTIPPRRLLIGHGTDDNEVPVQDARDLVAAAEGRAELRLIQGAGHQLRADPRMVATLLGWLDRHR